MLRRALTRQGWRRLDSTNRMKIGPSSVHQPGEGHVARSYATFRQRRNYDISPDGERFVMITEYGEADDDGPRPQITVVLNWREELTRLVPTN